MFINDQFRLTLHSCGGRFDASPALRAVVVAKAFPHPSVLRVAMYGDYVDNTKWVQKIWSIGRSKSGQGSSHILIVGVGNCFFWRVYCLVVIPRLWKVFVSNTEVGSRPSSTCEDCWFGRRPLRFAGARPPGRKIPPPTRARAAVKREKLNAQPWPPRGRGGRSQKKSAENERLSRV